MLAANIHDAAATATSPRSWHRRLSSLRDIFSRKQQQQLHQKSRPLSGSDSSSVSSEPGRLAEQLKPVVTRMLNALEYPGAPQIEAGRVEELLRYMYRRAVEFGVPLDTPISAKGFRLGYAEGLLPHPGHPMIVQGYAGLFTWLVVQYDDIVGQSAQMMEDALDFHPRLLRGERQANNLLEGIAQLLREAPLHFDPVMSNMLQISVLKFLTSNLLERHDGFQKMRQTPAGEKFPYFYRDMSGMDVAYAVFAYPKDLYPDASLYIEAFPDMAKFINISNDVLSLYKEELSGDKRNYINNLANCTGKPLFQVFEEVERDTIECAQRVDTILEGTGKYHTAWTECVYGYMAMHTTNPRYRLDDLGWGEPHPLEPFEHRIGELFQEMKDEDLKKAEEARNQ